MRRFLGITIQALFFCFASACALHPYHAAPPLDRPALRRDYLSALQQRYPAQFRLKQRLALRALGKQYDMIGYLAMAPGGGFRAYGMGEMGGRVFDLALEHGAPKIYKKPDTMPPNPLLDGVIGDIRHLFELPDFTSATVHASLERGSYLALRGGATPLADYVFEIAGGRPVLKSSLESDGRRILREAEFSGYRVFPGFPRPLPARIVIRNYRWHYAMEIETLEIIPAAPPAVVSR